MLLAAFIASLSCLGPTREVWFLAVFGYLTFVTTSFFVIYVAFSIWPHLILFDLTKEDKQWERDFYNDDLVRMEGRTMAKLESGRLALVPECCQNGDIIVVCKGGRVPLVLRKAAINNEYQIVGEGYVYRIDEYDESRCRRLVIV
jgi:hypothetical protein